MKPPPTAQTHPHAVPSPHGERQDEYYWLRDDDPKAKRPEVMRYLEEENAYAEAWLAPLAQLRQQLVEEMRSRLVDDESTPPVYDHGHWTWREYAPGAEYPRLMRQRGGPERPDVKAPKQVVLDQPARAAGHAFYKVGGTAVSPDGRWLAWAEDTGGRRIHTLRFKHIASGRELPESIPGVLEDLVWANDNATVFYILQDPVTLQSGPVYRHVLGSDASTDVKVYEEPDKTLFVELNRAASGRYVLIAVRGTETTETLAVPADRPAAQVRVVLARRPGVRHTADQLGRSWYIRTNEHALDFKLVSAPEHAPGVRSLWRTRVPPRAGATLEAFALNERGIAVQERVDADTRVRLLRPGGAALAGAAGVATQLGDNPDPRAAHLRFRVQSLVEPLATWDLHLKTGERLLRKRQPVPGYDAAQYATARHWAPSRDGRRIPITLAWRRDCVRRAQPTQDAQYGGTTPLLLIGYGSYGHSYDPAFSVTRPSLMDRGFVVALAHVRGGADLGETWYADGRLMNKQNSFNDFEDATDELVRSGWAAADKVFASGRSAGGLLMGAVANQAGHKYRGMVLGVPFVDVVTTMLDESIPLTANEWQQWGDPREKAAYDCMLSYSPYDQLRAQPYPSMLVTTGLWDSQVQYFEPAKYVARLRARKTDDNPLLFFTNLTAGHGGASGRYEGLIEVAREFAFMIRLASSPVPSVAAAPAPA